MTKPFTVPKVGFGLKTADIYRLLRENWKESKIGVMGQD